MSKEKNQMVKLEGLVSSRFFSIPEKQTEDIISSKILIDLSITKVHSFLKQCCARSSKQVTSPYFPCFEGNKDRAQQCTVVKTNGL